MSLLRGCSTVREPARGVHCRGRCGKIEALARRDIPDRGPKYLEDNYLPCESYSWKMSLG
jgi:hypothetical protein